MTNISRLLHLLLITILTTALTGCGGGGSSDSSTTAPDKVVTPNSSTAPGGLYVGYYLEDPSTNPEDPTLGAFVLNLPEGDNSFNGSMFFTYVGCQTSNVGNVVGTKSGISLSGTWSGTIDGTPESGPYSGTYNSTAGYYSGIYRNNGGKQFKDIPGCIQYYIAPNGTWEMFSVENNVPANFNVAVNGTTASWDVAANASAVLVYVLDVAVAEGTTGGNPVKMQTILPASVSNLNLATLGLTSGKQYVFVVAEANGSYQRVAFGSKRFIAP